MARNNQAGMVATRRVTIFSSEAPIVDINEGDPITPVDDQHAASMERIGAAQRKGAPVTASIEG